MVGFLLAMAVSHDSDFGTPGRPSFYQRRVGVLGKVLTIVWLVGNLASASIYVAMGWWREYFTLGTALYWVALLICFVVWMVCRRGTFPRRVVRAVESVSMMGSAIAVSLMGRHIAPQALELTAKGAGFDLATLEPEAFTLLAGLQLEQILVALMLGLAFGYVLRAALVPSTVRRTVWITVLAIVPLFALYVFDWLPLAADRSLREAIGPYQIGSLVVNVFIWWTLVTIVCVSISRIIHNLRREIREAMRLGQYRGRHGHGLLREPRHDAPADGGQALAARENGPGEPGALRTRGTADGATYSPQHHHHLRLRAHARRRFLLCDGVARWSLFGGGGRG
jgi:hypothetical protein